MSVLKHYDYLIVGQGLAGSLLAWSLINSGQRVLVVDNLHPAAASRVAAGLINPVTGKRLVMQPDVGVQLSAARDCYQALAKQFKQTFLHDKPMLRLFDSDEIIQAWQRRRTHTQYAEYLGEELDANNCGYPNGGFIQHKTGYLAIASLLEVLRNWLQDQSALLEAEFDYADLQLSSPLRWHTFQVKTVIFCEGAAALDNPWFRALPWLPAQGEILTLRTTHKLPRWIINAGRWLLPLANGYFKLGATYLWPAERRQLAAEITDAGKTSLLNSLGQLFPGLNTFEIISQQAGIRPATEDKQPFIGFHPQHSNLAIFNGFGSRGSLLIPFYARHFTDVLLQATDLQTNVDVQRIAK